MPACRGPTWAVSAREIGHVIIECQHCSRYLRNVFSQDRKSLDVLEGMRVAVVSGIAAPASFEKAVEEKGARIVHVQRFADHHRYTQQEIIDRITKNLPGFAISDPIVVDIQVYGPSSDSHIALVIHVA